MYPLSHITTYKQNYDIFSEEYYLAPKNEQKETFQAKG